MDRRQAIKRIMTIGTISIIPLSGEGIKLFTNRLSGSEESCKPFHVVGIGGGGCNALEYYYSQGFKAKYTCISSPERHYKGSKINFVKYLPSRHFHEIDDWSFLQLSIPNEVKSIFELDEKYVILIGLGGTTGTLLGKALFNYLDYKGKEFVFICSYPFSNEGTKRRNHAESAFSQFVCDSRFCSFKLDYLRSESEDLTISQAFKKADEYSYMNFLSKVNH